MKKKDERINLDNLTNAEITTLQEKNRQGEAGEYLHNIIRLRSGYSTNSGVCDSNNFDISSPFVEGETG